MHWMPQDIRALFSLRSPAEKNCRGSPVHPVLKTGKKEGTSSRRLTTCLPVLALLGQGKVSATPPVNGDNCHLMDAITLGPSELTENPH